MNIDRDHPIWGYKADNSDLPSFITRRSAMGTSKLRVLPAGTTVGMSQITSALCFALMYYIEKSPQCALGLTSNAYIAEVLLPQRSTGTTDIYEVAVYNPLDGIVYSSHYNTSSGRHEAIVINPETASKGMNSGTGIATWLAMLPTILTDDEASKQASVFEQLYRDSNFSASPDKQTEAAQVLGVFCDNVFCRVVETGSLLLELPSGRAQAPRIPQTGILKGNYSPKSVLFGDFKSVPTLAQLAASSTPVCDLSPFRLTLQHALTEEEMAMIPKLAPHHVITDNEIRCCKAVSSTWDFKNEKLRITNLFLEGGAGSGKTECSITMAAVLGLPRTVVTCAPDWTSDNVIGAIYPVVDNIDSTDVSDSDMKLLKQMSTAKEGITTSAIRDYLNIPSNEEMFYDPSGTYSQLTGEEPPDDLDAFDVIARADDLVSQTIDRLLKAMTASRNGEVAYKYVPSELVRAIKNGWLLEIQEPALIKNAGVLGMLNDVLEGGSLALPLEVVHRHPDCVIVFTSNRDYAGCHAIEESVRDRCSHMEKMDTPDVSTMVARTMAVTEFDDVKVVTEMADAMMVLTDSASSNAIRGVAGMRSLFNWAIAVKSGDPIEEAVLYKVIYKMTTDDDEVATLVNDLKNNTNIFKVRAKTA